MAPTDTVPTENAIIRVAAKSNANSTASAIAHMITETNRTVTIRCVGAAAVNQAVKAVAIAHGFVAPRGFSLYMIPSFDNIEIDGIPMSACVLKVHATN